MDDFDVIFQYTAEQAVKDGVLFDVTETAQKIFKVGCDMPWKYRVSINVHQFCNDEEEKLEGLLNAARLAIRNANKGDSLVEFKHEDLRLWACLDSTSGPAIHIITPEEY